MVILQNQQCRNDISGSERRLDFFPPLLHPPFYSRSGEECGDHSSETERVSFVPYSLLAGGRGSASLVPMTYCLRVLQLKVTHSHSTSSPPADFLILIPQCCL